MKLMTKKREKTRDNMLLLGGKRRHDGRGIREVQHKHVWKRVRCKGERKLRREWVFWMYAEGSRFFGNNT
jgi:hypothetical protein